MNRVTTAAVALVLTGTLGAAPASLAAPFTDHFAPLDAALGALQLELAASPDPLEQKAAPLVAKARRVLASASDGLRGDARIAQKLIAKLAKALGADLASLGPLLETALIGLADDVVAQIDAAGAVAGALPEGDRKTTKALKALERALARLPTLAAADGPTVEHARAVFAAASALVKLQLKIRRAGGALERRNFLTVEVEGGAPYEASQVSARFVESTATLEVRSSALRSSGQRLVLDFSVSGVDGPGFFTPSALSYAESETAVFAAEGPALDAEVGVATLDVTGGVVLGTVRASDLPAASGVETRTLADGGFELRGLEIVP